MTEEQLEAKRKYAGEKKPSMKRRADHHDYTERRMYMITLEVEGRKPVFGHLVGNPFAEPGSVDEARIELSALGKLVQSEWMRIHGYYPQIEVMAVQMMPDHMHGILFVKAPLPVHLGQVISGFKAGCRKVQRALEEREAKEATERETEVGRVAAKPQLTEKEKWKENGNVNEMLTTENGVGASQHGAALPSQENARPYHPLFAKGYNDLILRSYDELPKWQNYLRDNPRRLLMKHARPEWLRPFFGLRIDSHSYNGIGNRQLLVAPKRISVRVSRRFDEQKIAAETARYLEAAKQGAVLVSPAISPGEKRVMRAAFDAGFPTIVIMENGFTPLSKPHGEQFEACAKGKLLMLSPWEHHNEKRKITAEQCQQMNLMAMEICGQLKKE